MENLGGLFELCGWLVLGVATAIGWGLKCLRACFTDDGARGA